MVIFAISWSTGIRLAVNPSPSMPRGLYLESRIDAPKVGDIVAVCIPDTPAADVYRARHYLPASRLCPSGLATEVKPIVAGPGDVVAITKKGVVVDGTIIPGSKVVDSDSLDRPIEHMPIGWIERLPAGRFFLLATRIKRSLDSRYYGPVSRVDIRDRARPLITETGE